MEHRSRPNTKRLHNPPLLGAISGVALAYMIYYLWWRATATLNPRALTFSWALLLAEAFGVLSYALFSWMTQDTSPSRRHRPPRPGLKVDVFVPTYNESLEILEATIIGCNNIRYPHETHLLDDGQREEVRELALRMGCRYHVRPNREHAKAGNINAALKRTQGEFIAILDADMVPQPDFLDRTLAYFEEDPNLAFVQMPQEFYNQDSVQHDRKEMQWHEQALFYRVIQPGKNHSNSAFWCGSPSVVRREALDTVGGVAAETVTEDIHTSVRMHSRGWSSYFVNEPLAFGIAPQTIRSYLLQRLRWAQGTMQLYRSADCPLWVPGLTIGQRLSYLASFLAYFESFQKLALLITPTVIILMNVFPMQVNALIFAVHWIPYMAFNVLANQVGGRRFFRYYQTERHNVLKMVVFIQSTLTLLSGKRLSFQVTPKTVDASVYRNERRALRLYFMLLGIILGTVVTGVIKVVMHAPGTDVLAASVATFWAAYNAALVGGGVWEVLRRRHERRHYRFPVSLEGELWEPGETVERKPVQVENLSISGASLVVSPDMMIEGQEGLLHFHTPRRKCMILPTATRHHARLDMAGTVHIGLSFEEMKGRYRERLFEFLFVDLPRYAYADAYAEIRQPVAVSEPFWASHAAEDAPVPAWASQPAASQRVPAWASQAPAQLTEAEAVS